jgi:hypothetical protein
LELLKKLTETEPTEVTVRQFSIVFIKNFHSPFCWIVKEEMEFEPFSSNSSLDFQTAWTWNWPKRASLIFLSFCIGLLSNKSLARLASSSLANPFHEGNEQPERQINKDFPIQLHSPHYSFVSQTQEESISSSQFVGIWLDATELII